MKLAFELHQTSRLNVESSEQDRSSITVSVISYVPQVSYINVGSNGLLLIMLPTFPDPKFQT